MSSSSVATARLSARPPITSVRIFARSCRSSSEPKRHTRPIMSNLDRKSALRPPPDPFLVAIADYAAAYQIDSADALETARFCLMDTLACGFLALKYPACTRLLGPIVPGAQMSSGARVPGTAYELDPVQA